MLSINHLARVATAAAGALVLSTLSVAAAVGPGQTGAQQDMVLAAAGQAESANG
jgi:hypothetical protein